MNRLIIDHEGVWIYHVNGHQFHRWTTPDALVDARKVAVLWEDDELIAAIDGGALGPESDAKIVRPETMQAQPKRRGRRPKVLTEY